MITYIIIAITGIFSFIAFSNRELFNNYLFDPYLVKHKNQWYRVFTHAFLHGSWGHLLINMFVLWQFGTFVEHTFYQEFGSVAPIYYLILYFGGIFTASVPSLQKHADNPYYTSIGASGAVASILFSYILMFPTHTLGFMIVIKIPAIVFGALYLWYEKRLADQDVNDGIGHDAHYYGALFGVVATIIFKPLFIMNFFNQISYSLSTWLG
ncbi:MAG: rhomboid family intramembrane serine protease [Salibacteraceae bacterium]